ncbi:MAG: hypothetical protein WCA10_09505 [Terracidiphilus sp.]
MGSTFILVCAVALGTGLICLLCGYFWGRSNVRSQVEDALDKAHISADAREFSVREELEEKMVELAELRARAEELPRLREQLAQLQSERVRGSAGRANAYAPGNNAPSERNILEKEQQPAPVQESTDKAIQNLLKSIEERMKQSDEDSPVAIQESAKPPVKRFAVEIPPTVTQLSAKPARVEVPAAQPAADAKDEWQEFAASLAALKNGQK